MSKGKQEGQGMQVVQTQLRVSQLRQRTDDELQAEAIIWSEERKCRVVGGACAGEKPALCGIDTLVRGAAPLL